MPSGSGQLTTEQEAKDALREALAGRRVLVILDDVWELEQLQAVAVTVSPASLLVTTRKQELLVSLDAQEYPLTVLERPQSLRLLAEWTVRGTRTNYRPKPLRWPRNAA